MPVLRSFTVAVLSVLLFGGCASDSPASSGTSGGGSKGEQSALIDCGNVGNLSDPRCSTPSCDNTGKLGSGVSVGCLSGFPEFAHGFLDAKGNRLVVASHNSLAIANGTEGLLLAVDLKTGNRTLVSGTYQDPASGPVTKGSGPALGDIVDVIEAPDGSWLAVVGDASQQVIQVDPATGDRSLVLSADEIDCEALTKLTDRSIEFKHGFAVGDDGALYAVVNNGGGNGIVKFVGKNHECQLVSFENSSDTTANRGSGVSIGASAGFARLRLQDGVLWALEEFPSPSILRVDPKSGERRRVSSLTQKVGSGDVAIGNRDMNLGGGAAWTLLEFPDIQASGTVIGSRAELQPLDQPSGARTPLVVRSGPADQSDLAAIWPVPDSSLVILLSQKGAFSFLDPATGRSNTFSW